MSIDLPGNVAGVDAAAHLATLCGKIKDKVQAQAGGRQPLLGFDCAPSADNKRIVMTSGDAGEASSSGAAGGLRDASVRLKLGALNGGEEKDAVAALRPKEMPDRGTLTSGVLADPDLAGPPVIPGANLRSFQLSLDGGVPDPSTSASARSPAPTSASVSPASRGVSRGWCGRSSRAIRAMPGSSQARAAPAARAGLRHPRGRLVGAGLGGGGGRPRHAAEAAGRRGVERGQDEDPGGGQRAAAHRGRPL